MNRLRRATALVVIVLLAQLTLVGSGYTCLAGGTAAGAGEMASMPGMPGMTTGTTMSEMDVPGSRPADAGQPSAPRSESCDFPWAPQGCAAMVPCAPHAMTARGADSGDRNAPGHAELAWELDTPPSAIVTPDPPPPKA